MIRIDKNWYDGLSRTNLPRSGLRAAWAKIIARVLQSFFSVYCIQDFARLCKYMCTHVCQVRLVHGECKDLGKDLRRFRQKHKHKLSWSVKDTRKMWLDNAWDDLKIEKANSISIMCIVGSNPIPKSVVHVATFTSIILDIQDGSIGVDNCSATVDGPKRKFVEPRVWTG